MEKWISLHSFADCFLQHRDEEQNNKKKNHSHLQLPFQPNISCICSPPLMLVGVYAAAGGTSTSVVDTTGRALTNSQFHKTIGGWMMSSPVELCVHNICNCVSLYVCMQFAYLLRFPDRAADDDYDATAAAAFFLHLCCFILLMGKWVYYTMCNRFWCVRQCDSAKETKRVHFVHIHNPTRSCAKGNVSPTRQKCPV